LNILQSNNNFINSEIKNDASCKITITRVEFENACYPIISAACDIVTQLLEELKHTITFTKPENNSDDYSFNKNSNNKQHDFEIIDVSSGLIQVDEVVLVGGTSRVPLVRNQLRQVLISAGQTIFGPTKRCVDTSSSVCSVGVVVVDGEMEKKKNKDNCNKEICDMIREEGIREFCTSIDPEVSFIV
jgi:molecular chaperone DnaK (HSP70)